MPAAELPYNPPRGFCASPAGLPPAGVSLKRREGFLRLAGGAVEPSHSDGVCLYILIRITELLELIRASATVIFIKSARNYTELCGTIAFLARELWNFFSKF